MRYMIAKINKDTLGSFVGMLGAATATNVEMFPDELYSSAEEAKEAIKEKYQPELNARADEIWNTASNAKQEEYTKALNANSNACLVADKFFIIPVQDVVELTAVHKSRREKIMNDKTFKCKMVETSNDAFDYLIGREDIGFVGVCFSMGSFRTSYIISATQTGKMINIKTRNSEYVFEVLDGHVIDDVQLTDKEIKKIEDGIRGI